MAGKTLRNVAAFTIAPLLGGMVCGAVYVPVTALVQGEPFIGGWELTHIWMYTVGAYTALFALVIMIVLGAPLYLIFRRLEIVALPPFAISGAIAGVLCGLILSFANITGNTVVAAAFGAITGLFVSCLAWLIRRPDRDAANPDRAAS